MSSNAISASLSRLTQKKKVGYLKKGMYQIIPPEYSSMGSLPAEWFIDSLMKHLGIQYYTGLLSAAALYGAAHHAAQVFQVVCDTRIRNLKAGKLKICFYYSKNLKLIPTQDIKVPTGYMKLSTPEGTAFDLLRYVKQSGYLGNVATVLNDLAEEIDAQALSQLSQALSLNYSQRLGYLFDTLNYVKLTEPLYAKIKSRIKEYIPLRPSTLSNTVEKDHKWKILINEKVEADL